MLTNREFWKAAAVRAGKTFFQALVGVIGTAATMGEVDWGLALSSAVLAAIVSLATSMAGLPEVGEDA